jgi:two-component system NtrC family sensor kinase
MFQNAPILMVGLAPDGTTIFANPYVEQITEYPLKELLGRNWWTLVCPGKPRAQVTELLKDLGKGEIRDCVMTVTTKNGKRRHISWNPVNIYDRRDRLATIICLGLHASDKSMVWPGTHEEETDFHQMMAALGAGLVLLDKAMRILWANRLYSKWFGEIEEIQGKHCYDVFYRRDQVCDDCPILESNRTRALSGCERMALTRDGRERFFRLIVTPIKDERGKISHYLSLSVDITEQKTLEKRLLQTERLATIGEIATAMAHEIRNPLTPVGGFARYLKKQIPDDPLVQRSVDAIIKEVNRLERMIDGIQDFARMARIQYVKADLNSLVEKSLGLLASEIEFNRIMTEIHLVPDLPPVPMAPDLIGRVMVHLLRNSIQAMPEGGCLMVTTSKKGPFAEFRVTDTGPGIESDDMSQIFEAFFSKTGGLGLGLTISSRIVQDHGGRISAQKATGRGAVFVVELPLEPIDFPLPKRPSNGLSGVRRGKNKGSSMAK